ncbi:MAG: DMT family transporter [Kineosporiaceae bacterium]
MTDATVDRHSPLRAAYLATALVWGSSFLFIAVGLEGLAPLQVALARLVLGAAVLGGYVALRRLSLPRSPRVWGHFAVMGLLFCAVPFALFSWAQTSLSSGLASVYNATTPLWTLVLVLAFLRIERVTAARAVGIAVGFVGVCLVFAPALAAPGAAPPLAHLACLGATLCYGLALVWLRRFLLPLGLHAEVIAFGQVLCGTAWAALFVAVGGREPVELSAPVVVALVLLGALGTGLAYVWNTAVARGLGVTTASTVTYLTPLVGVALGVAVLGERVAWYEVVGGVVIVLGVALGQGVLRLRVRLRGASGVVPTTPSPRPSP